MLSKEEIEFNLKVTSNVMLNFEDELCDKMQERIKEIKEYINQLETDKQKLIEELEEEVTTDNIKAEMTKTEKILYRDIIQEVIEQTVKVVNEYRKEILKLAKGEKE